MNKRIFFYYFIILFLFSMLGISMSSDGWQWRVDHEKILAPLEGFTNLTNINSQIYGGHLMKDRVYQSSDKRPNIILVGDSYLRAYHSAIVKKYPQSNFLWYEAPGCEFFSIRYFGLTASKKKMDSCKHYRNESFKLLQSNQEIFLVIGQHWYASFLEKQVDSENFAVQPNLKFNNPKDYAEYVLSEIKLLQKLSGYPKVVIIGGPPKSGIFGQYWTSIWECIATPFGIDLDLCNTTKRNNKVLTFHDIFNKHIKYLIKQGNLQDISLINPYDVLCNDFECINFDDFKRPIYSDYGHLSIYGNEYVLNHLQVQFDKIFFRSE